VRKRGRLTISRLLEQICQFGGERTAGVHFLIVPYQSEEALYSLAFQFANGLDTLEVHMEVKEDVFGISEEDSSKVAIDESSLDATG
jgi:hypothetical protein